ncbi:hypothetical protein [Kribbella catacumbae]|uniref:hypothetical protein n=1 Tax=Kribbella catacumbae TaxID=460086 RepID=UPI0003811480|nr:hypothetical protein [Kribbella catacumbae]
MDDETAIAAVLVPTQLKRFREVCEVDGPIEPRFDGATKHVLLTEDRAFLFPRNHTIVAQLERECDVYATVDHPLVSKLLGRWDEPAISPYPFFAATRLRGSVPGDMSPEHLRMLAGQLGAALAACHDIGLEHVQRRLWDSASWAAERSYGDLRRHLWTAYAEHRSVPLPSWEQVHLALTTFDIVALAPETETHYYWQKSPEWQAARRAAARDCLQTQLR